MCCTRPPHVSVGTIFYISRYMYRRYTSLIRLLNTSRQHTLVFTRDSSEFLVYDILRLNVLLTGRLMIQLARYSNIMKRP
ncbi:hypothetical protein T265_12625, partial [Opisthorchis viverrini]